MKNHPVKKTGTSKPGYLPSALNQFLMNPEIHQFSNKTQKIKTKSFTITTTRKTVSRSTNNIPISTARPKANQIIKGHTQVVKNENQKKNNSKANQSIASNSAISVPKLSSNTKLPAILSKTNVRAKQIRKQQIQEQIQEQKQEPILEHIQTQNNPLVKEDRNVAMSLPQISIFSFQPDHKKSNTQNVQFISSEKNDKDLNSIIFHKQTEKLLSGKDSKEKNGKSDLPSFKSEDCFDKIGIVSLFYQNDSFIDGRYNHSKFLVEKGFVGNKQAYRISPPQNKASEFLGSEHALCFKLQIAQNYIIYNVDEKFIEIAERISQKSINLNSFTIVQSFKISKILKPITIVILPSNENFSAYLDFKRSEKLLSGQHSVQKQAKNNLPSISDMDCFQNIGVVSLFHQNSCFTDGRYNHNDFLVQKGSVCGSQAYKIHPPTKKATKFLASHHCICLKFSTKENYNIYSFKDGCFELIKIISKDQIDPKKFTVCSDIKISQLQAPLVIVAAPTSANLEIYQSLKKGEKMLPGKHSVEKNKQNMMFIDKQDCLDNFGVVSLFYQNSSFTDGRYNCSNYFVERGRLNKKQSYKIHPPKTLPTQFLGSKHCICLKFETVQDYTIYRFEDNCLSFETKVCKQKIKANEFTLLETITVSNIEKPFVIIAVPSKQKFTQFTIFKNEIEGGTIFKQNNLTVQLMRFPLPFSPQTPQKFPFGPNNHQSRYNPNRDFFQFAVNKNQFIIWSDEFGKNILLTKINRQLVSTSTIALKGKRQNFIFVAGCGDEEFVYFLQVQKGKASEKTGIRKLEIVKCSFQGEKIMSQILPTDKENLNVHCFDACALSLNKGLIGMILSKKNTISSDGLNHQSACASIIDSKTLKLIKQFGQTSGHSFSNSLLPKFNGGFIGMDLGDNFPRGINHFVFNENKITKKCVYFFKTLHGQTEKNPAGKEFPKYDEISNNEKTYYKWSNDNMTYTELSAPGVIEHTSGHVIIFSGENKPNSLDNSATGDYNNSSRNIGFVKVSTNMKDIVSKGIEETGGFYNFNGGWDVLKNEGVIWLTSLGNFQNASRVKAINIKDMIVIVFEIWSKTTYIETFAMTVDMDGKILMKPVLIPFKMKMQKSDDIYVTENSIVIYAGSKNKVLNRYEIFFNK